MQIIIPVAIVVGAYLVSFVATFLLDKIRHFTSKTKTTLDDEIIHALHRPARFIFILIGLYIALDYAMPELTFLGLHYSKYIVILAIILSAYLVVRIVGAIFTWYGHEIGPENKNIDKTLFRFLRRFSAVLIYVIALIIVLDRLGIEIGPLLAGLGIAGLAVALALQDTLANVFAGFYVAADKPYEIGDFIEIDTDTNGYVEDIGWRSTIIRTLPNNRIIVPNSKMTQSVIRNFHKGAQEMSVLVQVGVAYGSDLDKVEKVTVEVGKQIQETIEGAVKTHVPFIRYHTFADSSINFSVILRTTEYTGQYLLKHEFIKALKKRYDKERIEIPYPHRVIQNKN